MSRIAGWSSDTLKVLDRFNRYKLVEDSTLVGHEWTTPLYTILAPNNTVVGESHNRQAIFEAWYKAKRG